MGNEKCNRLPENNRRRILRKEYKMPTKKFVTRVRAFQKRNKLKVDGDFGPECMTAVEQLEEDNEALAVEANNCAKDVMRLNKTVDNQLKTINKQKTDLVYIQNIVDTQKAELTELKKAKVTKTRLSFFEWLRNLFVR